MSDILNLLSLKKFESHIQVDSEHCLDYVRRQCVSTEEIILTVHIPYECLKQWHEAKYHGALKETECTYVQILNAFIRDSVAVRIKNDCERIEGRLRRSCAEIKKKFFGKSGASYRKLLQNNVKIAVHADEIVTISNVESELQKEVHKNEQLQQENECLKNRCEELYCQMIKAQATTKEITKSLDESSDKIEKLAEENQELHSYINKLGQHLEFRNSSKKIGEVGERQQRRQIRKVKTRIEKALWFAKTFGLDLQSVTLSDDMGGSHTMAYTEKEKRSYKDLLEEEQKKVKSILYLLDKFCIGDNSYHELTMSPGGEDLPRSYLIKQCKDDLNKLCHITRTPGQAEGAQVDFKSELESIVKKKVTITTAALFLNLLCGPKHTMMCCKVLLTNHHTNLINK